jgi:hypothetical protein
VQSTLTLLDGDSGDSIDLTSTDYGAYTNGIKIKVEAGTTAGKKITTSVGRPLCHQRQHRPYRIHDPLHWRRGICYDDLHTNIRDPESSF